ncbi:MAG: imidazole glycerol phosphate synthase subunit HisF [Myxococcales bacterium]|nr:imidazole glycerol phosphate synthase subunit HisF [Myxococcales bacterium]
MLTTRLIPCLDIRDGRVVKGIKFQAIRDAGDPVECAYRYQEDGADELVVLDISATLESRRNSLEVIQAIREVLNIPLTVGGGVRSLEDVRALLEAGADKVSINSAAVAQPQMIRDIAQLAGKQCTVVAIDAAQENGVWQVLTHSGKRRAGLMALEWAQTIENLGGGELLLTSWDRDGTRSGYDLDLLSAMRSVTRLPIIASGGAASAKHMIEAIDAGADAVLAASIFHDGETSCNQLKMDIQQKYKRTDIKVRL